MIIGGGEIHRRGEIVRRGIAFVLVFLGLGGEVHRRGEIVLRRMAFVLVFLGLGGEAHRRGEIVRRLEALMLRFLALFLFAIIVEAIGGAASSAPGSGP